MRHVEGAVALISREREGRREWLAQWNDEIQRFDLVGGPKSAEESFRDCVAREITGSLALEPGKDFLVSGGPQAHLEFTARSESDSEETQYRVELYDVQLFGRSSRERIDSDTGIRWVTADEIRQRRCADGQPIGELTSALFSQADLLSD